MHQDRELRDVFNRERISRNRFERMRCFVFSVLQQDKCSSPSDQRTHDLFTVSCGRSDSPDISKPPTHTQKWKRMLDHSSLSLHISLCTYTITAAKTPTSHLFLPSLSSALSSTLTISSPPQVCSSSRYSMTESV